MFSAFQENLSENVRSGRILPHVTARISESLWHIEPCVSVCFKIRYWNRPQPKSCMSPTVALPDKITPEQFAKAEPLVLTLILQDPDSGYGDSVQPLTEDDFKSKRVRRVKPGEYVGEFRDKLDPRKRFSFKLSVSSNSPTLVFSPINPELFKEPESNANQK